MTDERHRPGRPGGETAGAGASEDVAGAGGSAPRGTSPSEPESRTSAAGPRPTGEGDAAADAEAALAEARRLADEHWDRYLRAEADLDNLRRRSRRLTEEALRQQRRELLGRFLEVADDLERALSHVESDPGALVGGVESIARGLSRLLALDGVAPIAALGEPFDSALHEAVGVVRVPAGDDGRVVAVERTGYTIDGDLLRPARVMVGRASDAAAGDGDGT